MRCQGYFLKIALWLRYPYGFPQQHSFFSSWVQYSVELLKVLNVTSDHSCHKYSQFLI